MEWTQYDALEPISITRLLLEQIAITLSTPEKRVTPDDLTAAAIPLPDDELDPEEAEAQAREEAMERANKLLLQMIGVNADLGGHDLRQTLVDNFE